MSKEKLKAGRLPIRKATPEDIAQEKDPNQISPAKIKMKVTQKGNRPAGRGRGPKR